MLIEFNFLNLFNSSVPSALRCGPCALVGTLNLVKYMTMGLEKDIILRVKSK